MLVTFGTCLRLVTWIEEEVIIISLPLNIVEPGFDSLFFFARTVVGHWSRLSKDIVSVNTPESFKTQLDKHFIGKRLAYKYSWDKTISVSSPLSPVLAVGSRLPSSYTRVGASVVPVEAVVGCVLSVSASFLAFTAFCFGGGGCNLLWALVVLIGQKFIIGIFAILCHFCHYAIVCH